jgi:hypothetical protein
MKNIFAIFFCLCFSINAFADLQDGAEVGEAIRFAMQSEKFQAEIKKQNLEDQMADKVVLELIAPPQRLYGLRVTYNTGTRVCEVNVPMVVLRINGEKPLIDLLRADSKCE